MMTTNNSKDNSVQLRLMHKGHPLEYRPWQQKVQAARRRFTVIALHRRAGKSVYACAELISSALHCTVPNAKYAYISPFKSQTKQIAWGVFKDLLSSIIGESQKLTARNPKAVPLVSLHESYLIITFPQNNVSIHLLGADDPDSLRGQEYFGVVFDEVAQLKPEIWREVMQPSLMSTHGWALFIGTPKGINLFSELFDHGLSVNSQLYPEWISHKFTCYETQALAASEIEAYAEELGGADSNVFRREMLCDFDAGADDQLIKIEDVNNSVARHYAQSYGETIMGVDVARMGGDKAVLCVRQGDVILDIIQYPGQELTQLASYVYDAYLQYPQTSKIFIDSTGVGAAMPDILAAYRIPAAIHGINFASGPSDKMFLNRRAEMWYRMAEWVRNTGRIPNIPELKKELAAPTYSYNEANRIKLEDKESIRKRLGFSPDLADAMALTFTLKTPPKLPERYERIVNRDKYKAQTPFSRFEQAARQTEQDYPSRYFVRQRLFNNGF